MIALTHQATHIAAAGSHRAGCIARRNTGAVAVANESANRSPCCGRHHITGGRTVGECCCRELPDQTANLRTTCLRYQTRGADVVVTGAIRQAHQATYVVA